MRSLATLFWRFCLMVALSAPVFARDLSSIAEEVGKAVPEAFPVKVLDSFAYGQGKKVGKFSFPNGLTVIILEDHAAPVLSYQTWFRVGSSYEKKGKTGVAHLFEHLMFKGTKAYPHEVFDRLLEEAGAQTNAATWVDWTFYYENLPAGQLELACKLESDRMVNLLLTKELFDSEREVVKNERRFRVENDPDGAMDEALLEMMFPTHPYGRPTLGYMKDIEALTLDDAVAFYRTYYSPANATLVVVGAVKMDEALLTVARYYASLPRVEVPHPTLPGEAEQTKAATKTLTLPVANEKLKMGWRICPAASPDVYPLEVVYECLFGTESSRVYRTLVEEMQVASEVDGAFEPLAQDGFLMADIVMNEGKDAAKAMEVVLSTLEDLAREGPTDAELSRAKNQVEASYFRSIATVGSRATQLGAYELTAGDFKRMFQYVDGVRAVGRDDVRRVAGQYLTRERTNAVFGRPGR